MGYMEHSGEYVSHVLTLECWCGSCRRFCNKKKSYTQTFFFFLFLLLMFLRGNASTQTSPSSHWAFFVAECDVYVDIVWPTTLHWNTESALSPSLDKVRASSHLKSSLKAFRTHTGFSRHAEKDMLLKWKFVWLIELATFFPLQQYVV